MFSWRPRRHSHLPSIPRRQVGRSTRRSRGAAPRRGDATRDDRRAENLSSLFRDVRLIGSCPSPGSAAPPFIFAATVMFACWPRRHSHLPAIPKLAWGPWPAAGSSLPMFAHAPHLLDQPLSSRDLRQLGVDGLRAKLVASRALLREEVERCPRAQRRSNTLHSHMGGQPSTSSRRDLGPNSASSCFKRSFIGVEPPLPSPRAPSFST